MDERATRMGERARLMGVNQDMRCYLIFYKGVGMNKKLVFKMHFELILNTFSLCGRIEQEVCGLCGDIPTILAYLFCCCLMIFVALIPMLWGFPHGYTPFFPA